MVEIMKKCFRIAEVIAAFITGSQTDFDRKELEAWCGEMEHNSLLANKLMNPEGRENNEKELRRFPADEAWCSVEKHIDKADRRLRFRRVAACAAVLLLFVSAGGLFWWAERDVLIEKSVVPCQIRAGVSGAQLILGDGRVIDVAKDERLALTEADGTTILKDSAGISYVNPDTIADTEVYNTMQTLTGMEYALTLSDGTKVFLNAESRLKYPAAFKGGQRVVELGGEAYFKVAKDSEHPFVVQTGDVTVQVYGTSFNIRSYEDEANVVTTLAEGKVSVNQRNILPGEQAVFSKSDGRLDVLSVDVGQYTAWQNGKFVFRNERLEDVMKSLSRWYQIEYHFLDEASKSVAIGASFDRYDDMAPILDMLKRTGVVQITQTDKAINFSVK